jgi:Lipase (class 3)
MRITGKLHSAPWVQPVFNTTLQLLYPAQQSMAGLWPLLDAAITRAIDATANPAAARIFLTGHSLGGASACIAALLLASEGRRVSGVWAFDPYKTGTRCAAGQNCWVSLYDRHLGNVTVAVWNNQDPIPQLVDASSPQPAASDWGHVPSDRGWVRIVGDACLPASGTPLMDACPPEVAAAGGSTDGKCASPFGDHLPWVVLRRIASCALLQGSAGRDVLALPRDVSAARVAVAAAKESGAVSTSTYACTQGAVWTKLLGLSPPGRR